MTNPTSFTHCKRQFQVRNLDVAVALTGAQGLALVREYRPDVVMLDVHLGDMSGMDVFDNIRQFDARYR